MDEPASKRRRVSPRNSSAGVGSSNATPQSTEALRRRPKRPSYASPTRASLARSQPQVLERMRSASPLKPHGAQSGSASTSTGEAVQRPTMTFDAPPTPTVENVGASDPAEEEDQVPRDTTAPVSPRSEQSTGVGFRAPAKRSPAKPNPRPLPPPGPEGDDEFNSFLGRRTRRSPNTGRPISHPEPELPPSVPDVVSSTPPRGIHSSPSRWREKPKTKKSSPLKPLADRLREAGGKSTKPMRGFSAPTRPKENSDSQLVLDETTNPSRRVPAYDPNLEKKEEKSRLRDEISNLKRDLQIVNKENERIRAMQLSGRILSSTGEDDVLDVVRRCLVDSEIQSLPPPSEQLMKAALNPMGLLPFGRPTSVVTTTDDQENVAGIKSHHPLQMAMNEELPYLQVFSPFDVTSTLAVLPPEPNQSLRQRRVITFRSRDSPGLFTTRIEMVVNAMNLTIIELNVSSLEPAAKPELGPFLEKICAGDCNRSMQRNVGIVSWAMGEWHRVAVQRARLWSQLYDEITSKGGLLQVVEKARKRKPRRSSNESESEEAEAVSCSQATLARFLGERAFEFDIPPRDEAEGISAVRLEWEIEFDWTGEAQSKLDVRIGVPGKWRKADQRGVFGKLPSLFENLIEGGEDPATAVKKIVALVVGERQS